MMLAAGTVRAFGATSLRRSSKDAFIMSSMSMFYRERHPDPGHRAQRTLVSLAGRMYGIRCVYGTCTIAG